MRLLAGHEVMMSKADKFFISACALAVFGPLSVLAMEFLGAPTVWSMLLVSSLAVFALLVRRAFDMDQFLAMFLLWTSASLCVFALTRAMQLAYTSWRAIVLTNENPTWPFVSILLLCIFGYWASFAFPRLKVPDRRRVSPLLASLACFGMLVLLLASGARDDAGSTRSLAIVGFSSLVVATLVIDALRRPKIPLHFLISIGLIGVFALLGGYRYVAWYFAFAVINAVGERNKEKGVLLFSLFFLAYPLFGAFTASFRTYQDLGVSFSMMPFYIGAHEQIQMYQFIYFLNLPPDPFHLLNMFSSVPPGSDALNSSVVLREALPAFFSDEYNALLNLGAQFAAEGAKFGGYLGLYAYLCLILVLLWIARKIPMTRDFAAISGLLGTSVAYYGFTNTAKNALFLVGVSVVISVLCRARWAPCVHTFEKKLGV